MLKYSIYTFGCKANKYDSALLASVLDKTGIFAAARDDMPDVILVNTCTVTGQAGAQARQKLRSLRRISSKTKVFALGCYARIEAQKLNAMNIADGIIEEDDPLEIVSMIARELGAVENYKSLKNSDVIESFPGHTRAFLKVQDGCDSFCSYCIIPFVRGKPRSMRIKEVIDQIEIFSGNGDYKEVVLTGIHLGIYGRDLGITLVDLLKEIELLTTIPRIRLSSIEPDEISNELIELIGRSERIMRHLHIPMQSGDDEILRAMARPYSSGSYAEKIKRIRRILPSCGIGTDIIAGFPGESEENFNRTLSMVNDLPFSYIHVFPFSRRKGTKAFDLKDQLHSKVIKKRAADLRKLGDKKKLDFRRSLLGSSEKVLIEEKCRTQNGLMGGFTGNYVPVYVELAKEKDYINTVVEVRLDDVEGERMLGKINEEINEKNRS